MTHDTEEAGRSIARRPRIAIAGCVGVPAQYGGFETLAANLVQYRQDHALPCDLEVYCSKPAYRTRPKEYVDARLFYVPLQANGVSSILYDALSILWAIRRKSDVILVLGVSGAIILPLARLITRAKFVVNIDGLEWRREKWSRAAAAFLRFSEKIAVRFADIVVADNRGIVDHVADTYGRGAEEIAYGGDHAIKAPTSAERSPGNGTPYALMLCRIEPENNIHMILEAFARDAAMSLVAVGNWSASEYGRNLRQQYGNRPGLSLCDPVFEPARLFQLRRAAALYVHGHSAGGTNPSLVEMMHFGIPVAAYDCVYNRHTTEQKATYFKSSDDLASQLAGLAYNGVGNGPEMKEIAERRYCWTTIGQQYFSLML